MSSIRALWLLLALAACGGTYSSAPTPPPPPPPPPPPGGNPPSSASVAMTSGDDGYGSSTNLFSPAAVTIARAGTVTWSNNSGAAHNVTFGAEAGAPANVPNLTTGSASRTFASAGTFAYQCTNHTGMTGQVIVQ